MSIMHKLPRRALRALIAAVIGCALFVGVVAVARPATPAQAFTGGGGLTRYGSISTLWDGDTYAAAAIGNGITSTGVYVADYGLLRIHALNTAGSTTATLTILAQYSLEPNVSCASATRYFDGVDGFGTTATTLTYTVSAGAAGGREVPIYGRCARLVLTWSNAVSTTAPFVYVQPLNRQ